LKYAEQVGTILKTRLGTAYNGPGVSGGIEKMTRFDVTRSTDWSSGAPAHGGNLEAECRAAGVDPTGVLDFSANVNALGPPQCLEAALDEAVKLASVYPDPQCTRARAALARAHNVKPESILVGNGSTELLYLAIRILHPEKMLVLAPCYCDFVRAGVLAGSRVELKLAPPDKLFRHDLTEMADVSDYHFVVTANPNDPTGTFIKPHEIIEAAAENPGTFFLVDEAFVDFIEGPGASLIGINYRNVIVVKSLTKFFGVPGVRLGMLWADPQVAGILRDRQEPWSVNGFAQKLATMLYDEEGYIATTHRMIKRERSFLTRGLTEAGFRVFDSPANFLLLRIEDKSVTSADLKKRLLQKKMLIRDCSNIEGLGNRFVRVAVRRHHENVRLLEAVGEVLEHGSDPNGAA